VWPAADDGEAAAPAARAAAGRAPAPGADTPAVVAELTAGC